MTLSNNLNYVATLVQYILSQPSLSQPTKFLIWNAAHLLANLRGGDLESAGGDLGLIHIYVYIYIYICTHMCIHIYIYTLCV